MTDYSSALNIFRQQLHEDDDGELAEFLSFQHQRLKNFDVFVFELCKGNISKKTDDVSSCWKLTISESISVCNQLIQGLMQLEKSNSCHNDLKPGNILYSRDESGNLIIKISDFGQAGRTGGTPGWTWPKFLTKRSPGKSDLYSVGLLMLYVMCADREVFYRIRNNYVKNHGQQWLIKLRNDPFFKLIIDMMNLKVTAMKAKKRWKKISGQ